MTFTNAVEIDLLDHIFNDPAYTASTTIYCGLITAVTDGEAGTVTEATGTNYARVSTPDTLWDAATGGTKQNGSAITFPQAGSGGWGTVTHFGLWDASTAGNLLLYGTLDASKVIDDGDTPSFAIGAFDIDFTGNSPGPGGLTTYTENELLDHFLNDGAWDTSAITIHVGLFTSAPSDAGGGTEVSGGSYARVSHGATSDWNAAASGSKSNATQVDFPTATASWGTVTHFGLFDASTSGNLIAWGPLASSVTVDNGDTPSIAAGEIVISID